MMIEKKKTVFLVFPKKKPHTKKKRSVRFRNCYPLLAASTVTFRWYGVLCLSNRGSSVA
jgi:hypothetical protein